jgi:hypothetical protein
MLKKSASSVLASFRHSTYPRGYAFESSLAAALLNGLFEHPEGMFAYCAIHADHRSSSVLQWLFRSLLARITDEHFCSNRRSGTTTSLRPAGSLSSDHTHTALVRIEASGRRASISRRSSAIARRTVVKMWSRKELPGPERTAIEMDELRSRIKPYPTILQLQRGMANLTNLDTGNIEVERLPLDM